MQVKDAMTTGPRTCGPGDDLGKAAIEMWQGDCGMLPVVRGERLIGVVTDRDICMGLALSGRRPADRLVQEVMSKEVFACTPDDDVGDALEIMGSRRVRRLPVVDGDRLVGVLSMNDILNHSGDRGQPPAREILAALRAICRPRNRPAPEAVPVRRVGAA